MEQCDVTSLSEKEEWNVFGYAIPKQEVVFFSQIIVLYLVIIVSLINITFENGDDNIWLSLLSASIGYALPNPSIKRHTIIVQRAPI